MVASLPWPATPFIRDKIFCVNSLRMVPAVFSSERSCKRWIIGDTCAEISRGPAFAGRSRWGSTNGCCFGGVWDLACCPEASLPEVLDVTWCRLTLTVKASGQALEIYRFSCAYLPLRHRSSLRYRCNPKLRRHGCYSRRGHH